MSQATRLALVLTVCLSPGCRGATPSAIQKTVEETALQEPEPAFLADSPFDGVFGTGGGAGGRYGARYGGKRLAAPTTETYAPVRESGFREAALELLSTFSIDVDSASYANVRRHLERGSLPPRDAVRIEELLNAFRYDDPAPAPGAPFAVATEVASCPWQPQHRLVRIGIRATELDLADLPPANLVFLIDVSGSMSPQNKLPLLVRSLRLLVEQLNDRDRVAIVVYAGHSGLALPSTPCSQKSRILAVLGELTAGGSTAGAAGIELAYRTAREAFVEGGTNRVVLATDGDFNVGVSDRGALQALIEGQAASGVFLSVLGFGMDNLRDDVLETLADRGNGNYAYVDSLQEARRVLVEELDGTLVTVAKDVKIQVEFNPLEVRAWRLVGYENRVLEHSEFLDDAKDAGEIGAGHSVTALYEVIPAGLGEPAARVDPLRYQVPPVATAAAFGGELMQVKLRWKAPDTDTSVGSSTVVRDGGATWYAASDDFRFAASLATFGMVLRESEHRGSATLALARELAREGLGEDARGHRAEYARLLETAAELGLP